MSESLKRGVLLVAEDDLDDQMLIQDAIAALGKQVDLRFVEDGGKLLAYLYENGEEKPPPELILLDLNMPGRDGRFALRMIKSDPALAHLPVIVLTTSRSDEDRFYCQRLGVEDYFQKPSSFKELTDILDAVLSRFIIH